MVGALNAEGAIFGTGAVVWIAFPCDRLSFFFAMIDFS